MMKGDRWNLECHWASSRLSHSFLLSWEWLCIKVWTMCLNPLISSGYIVWKSKLSWQVWYVSWDESKYVEVEVDLLWCYKWTAWWGPDQTEQQLIQLTFTLMDCPTLYMTNRVNTWRVDAKIWPVSTWYLPLKCKSLSGPQINSFVKTKSSYFSAGLPNIEALAVF